MNNNIIFKDEQAYIFNDYAENYVEASMNPYTGEYYERVDTNSLDYRMAHDIPDEEDVDEWAEYMAELDWATEQNEKSIKEGKLMRASKLKSLLDAEKYNEVTFSKDSRLALEKRLVDESIDYCNDGIHYTKDVIFG